eukprot:gene7734-7933_t
MQQDDGEQGGLVKRDPGERHVFKVPAPKTSLLGLDALARQKRAERGEPDGTPGSSVRPAGGSSTGASGIGRVRFEVEASPALTPSWKSTSWARTKKKEGQGAAGEESPELGDEGAPEFDEALK